MTILLHNNNLLPWPVWLTNWSYLLLTCHLLCAAIIVLLHACFERRHSTLLAASSSTSIPCYMKFSWFLFSVSSTVAIIVSSVYFAGVFPGRHRDYLNLEDINLHVMNSVLVMLEFAIAAYPLRLLHVVYVWLYCLAYVIFSAIYWAFDHSHVMYPGVLDWNAPAITAVVLVVLTIVGIPLLQFILFSLFQLRMFIYTRVYEQSLE